MTDHADVNGTPIDLPAVLAAHRRWRETGGLEGSRANLAGAYLAGANLAGAYLAGADIGNAAGCVLLTETDHGYRVIAGFYGGEWRIWAGCRDFSIDEAREHWGSSDYHLPISGRRVVACLDWLEREIAAGLVIGGAK